MYGMTYVPYIRYTDKLSTLHICVEITSLAQLLLTYHHQSLHELVISHWRKQKNPHASEIQIRLYLLFNVIQLLPSLASSLVCPTKHLLGPNRTMLWTAGEKRTRRYSLDIMIRELATII